MRKAVPGNNNQEKLQGVGTILLEVKACTKNRDLHKGSQLHIDVHERGLLKRNIYVGSALVNMYVKCSEFIKARLVFDELLVQDVVCWNSLIVGYTDHGYYEDAVICFEQMQREGVSPNSVTFACILKACSSIAAVDKGEEIHSQIISEQLLEKDIVLATALVDMYATCGVFSKAQKVFDELPVRDVVTWNSLIAGYTLHGHTKEALLCFDEMQSEGRSPSAVTFTCILNACGSIEAAERGEKLHAEILTQGLLKNDIVLGTALVDMYAACGALVKAQCVFDELPVKDVVSWNALISGYTKYGHDDKVWDCFQKMQADGLSPDAVTFTYILKVCGNSGANDKGEEIHAHIVGKGLLNQNGNLCAALVDMYAKIGAVSKAAQVFDELSIQDVLTWNALISGYIMHGYDTEALLRFEQMQSRALCPNGETFIYILKACSSLRDLERGQKIHAEMVEKGLSEKNIAVGTALVDIYAKCGALTEAEKLFEGLPIQDAVVWTAMIAGYAEQGYWKEAISHFEQMESRGFLPDAISLGSMLKACGNIGDIRKGENIYAKVARENLLEKDVVLGNALVDMYAKCGALGKAQDVFDDLPVQDVITWNSLITGYAQHGYGEQALNCLERMQKKGFLPDATTFTCILKACGCIGVAKQGEKIHADILRQGSFGKDGVLGNTLIDMYAKCGALTHAQEAFDNLLVRDPVSWNAMIAGHSQHGHCEQALSYFEQMQNEGLCPDAVTYTCIIDHFGRVGHFEKAMEAIKEMPSSDNLGLWFALLNACQLYGNVKLGRIAFDHAVQLDGQSAVAYVSMRNLYAGCGMQEDADTIEALRTRNEALKKPAHSWWADLSGDVHSFCVGDKSHSQSGRIYIKLEDITKKLLQEGYLPNLSQDISNSMHMMS